MTVWYTSDQHFFHANIIDHCGRPFADVDEMNEALVDRWNAVVKPADAVWVVGDVALSPKGLGPVARLNGYKVLVAGNHDSCWDGHKRWRRAVQVYMDAGFRAVVPSGVVDRHVLLGGIPVKMSHLPYAGDSHPQDRYADRRPVDDGLVLIHGHVHEMWKVRGRMLNVGVDVWDYVPVHQDVVIDEVRALYRMESEGTSHGH